MPESLIVPPLRNRQHAFFAAQEIKSTRNIILSQISLHPGIHFRALQRVSKLSVGQLQHHLHSLLRKKEIAAFPFFQYTCYCLPQISPEDRTLYAVLMHPVCKQIISHLLTHKDAHCHHVTSHIKLSPSTLSWYLSRLRKENIIMEQKHGKHKCLHLAHPQKIAELIH